MKTKEEMCMFTHNGYIYYESSNWQIRIPILVMSHNTQRNKHMTLNLLCIKKNSGMYRIGNKAYLMTVLLEIYRLPC